MKKSLSLMVLSLAASVANAQQGNAVVAVSGTAAPQTWIYQTKQLDRAEVNALLAAPEKLLVIDVRRPDELTVKGSFPVYLNIQTADVEKNLAYIPKDRAIVTVSNHAHRAGAVGDLLTSKGFNVAGAAGSEDYEAQGGKIVRVASPTPKQAALTVQK